MWNGLLGHLEMFKSRIGWELQLTGVQSSFQKRSERQKTQGSCSMPTQGMATRTRQPLLSGKVAAGDIACSATCLHSCLEATMPLQHVWRGYQQMAFPPKKRPRLASPEAMFKPAIWWEHSKEPCREDKSVEKQRVTELGKSRDTLCWSWLSSNAWVQRGLLETHPEDQPTRPVWQHAAAAGAANGQGAGKLAAFPRARTTNSLSPLEITKGEQKGKTHCRLCSRNSQAGELFYTHKLAEPSLYIFIAHIYPYISHGMRPTSLPRTNYFYLILPNPSVPKTTFVTA